MDGASGQVSVWRRRRKARPLSGPPLLLCPPSLLGPATSSQERGLDAPAPCMQTPGIRGEPVLSWWNRALRLQDPRPRPQTTIQPGLRAPLARSGWTHSRLCCGVACEGRNAAVSVSAPRVTDA